MNIPLINPQSIGTDALREALAQSSDGLMQLSAGYEIYIHPGSIKRFNEIADAAGAALIYSDALSSGNQLLQRPDFNAGSIRNDFDFGPLIWINPTVALRVLDSLPPGQTRYAHASFYALWLALSRAGLVCHIPEPLYSVAPQTDPDHHSAHFNYVDPAARTVQIEMEQAFTYHLKEIGAWLPAPEREADFGGMFPVEASVIIPVRNRANTIGDAIFSALDQQTAFPFNVIVVDNHSSDGTTDIIRRLSDDSRLIHLIPAATDLGIGGCWNEAISHPLCGRFAIQLDSDDIYNSPDTLQRIVDCFMRLRCAMVVGAYTITDFNLRPIPPGDILHSEWTPENGHNNLLRINGLGAPRAFATAIARQMPFPNVSYGEDYAMGLAISRSYTIGRIFRPLYLCRRWEGNSDSRPSHDKMLRFNHYKDSLRAIEICARQRLNSKRK